MVDLTRSARSSYSTMTLIDVLTELTMLGFLKWGIVDDPDDPEGDPAVQLTHTGMFRCEIVVHCEQTLSLRNDQGAEYWELPTIDLYWMARGAAAGDGLDVDQPKSDDWGVSAVGLDLSELRRSQGAEIQQPALLDWEVHFVSMDGPGSKVVKVQAVDAQAASSAGFREAGRGWGLAGLAQA